jgi:pyruvate dehydrogenase E2 component (dihydrolipoamide acetyltransferase)
MNSTIAVDHRVSDGAEAAQFMQKLAEFLENPVGMLVQETSQVTFQMKPPFY